MTNITGIAIHDDRTVPPAKYVNAEQLPIDRHRSILALFSVVVAVVGGCASVPGETAASAGERREVTAKVVASASQGHAACKQVKIVDSQVVEVQGDGKVAVERWVVDRCGERLNYRVSYPAKSQRNPIQVKAE